METIAEFKIQQTLCRVVAEESFATGTDPAPQTGGPRGLTSRVIGDCTVSGRRYLILCDASIGSRTTPGCDSARDLLTPRELQVALLVAAGHGNKQIAYRLKLSEWTVSSYLRRIFVKLGVRTRAAMVARMLDESVGRSFSMI